MRKDLTCTWHLSQRCSPGFPLRRRHVDFASLVISPSSASACAPRIVMPRFATLITPHFHFDHTAPTSHPHPLSEVHHLLFSHTLPTMVSSRALALDVSQPGAAAMALDQDWQALGVALANLGAHLASTVGRHGVGGVLQWLAVIAAIYLLVLNRTQWRTNVLTALLVPYLALQLPGVLFHVLRGDIGAWIAFIAVVIRLFFAQKFPDLIHGDMELPIAFILLVVTAPGMIVGVRGTVWCDIISLLIGLYLLIEHTNNSGGVRRAFGETRGGSNSFGILLLFVAPAWALFWHIF